MYCTLCLLGVFLKRNIYHYQTLFLNFSVNTHTHTHGHHMNIGHTLKGSHLCSFNSTFSLEVESERACVCKHSDASQCKGRAAMTCTVRVCLRGKYTIKFPWVGLKEKEDVREKQFNHNVRFVWWGPKKKLLNESASAPQNTNHDCVFFGTNSLHWFALSCPQC